MGPAAVRGRTFRLIAFALVLAVLPAMQAAVAQSVDCSALRAQIGAARGGDVEQFAAALRQQQDELSRTQDYFDSIGCGSGLFGGGPPQCGTLNLRMGRMQANIIRLQDQTQDAHGGGDDRRRGLIEQFNSFCSTGASERRDQGEDPQVMPIDPDAPPPADGGEGTRPPPEAPQSRIKALCVRSCDGGYFPMTDDASASDASLDHLGQLCKAMCPGTEAALYTTTTSGGIDTASARDGSPYSALPTAFRFQKSYDPTCSCKPPHQSWVDALAGAETLIHNDKTDVTVTQKLSDQMSQPSQPRTPAAKAVRKKAAPRKPKSQGDIADQTGIVIPPPPQDGEDLTRQFR